MQPRVAEEGAVGNVKDTSTLIGAVTPQTETEMVTEEMVVWDGPKKRIFDGHPFTKDEHSCPKVRVDPQTDIPLTNTGHLPNLGTIDDAEEERLQALYVRDDEDTYLLKKNRHTTPSITNIKPCTVHIVLIDGF